MARFLDGKRVSFIGKDPAFIGNALHDHAAGGLGSGVHVTLTSKEVKHILETYGTPIGRFLYDRLRLSFNVVLRGKVEKHTDFRFDPDGSVFQTFPKRRRKPQKISAN